MVLSSLRRPLLAALMMALAHSTVARVSASPSTPQNILAIPQAAFQPLSQAEGWGYDDAGYLYATGGGFEASLFVAPVALPDGAVVDSIGLYYCLDDTTAYMLAVFRTLPGGGTDGAPPVIADLGFAITPIGTTGCNYVSAPLGGATINNDVNNGGKQYVIDIQINNPTAAARFKGVDVRWHRQVSPAPASATFNDVPISDPAFQFIEAFNAAGITAGCSAAPPLYCPDAAVTRRQMAVFFAKALGLQWPQ
jgi:hypothetical protein